MSLTHPGVGLVRGSDRRGGIYRALDLVREEVTPKLRAQVMLKPNCLSSTNQLASSHVDALRGVIDFLMSVPNPPEEIIVAEGANEKYSGEAYDNFEFRNIIDETPVPVRFIDLNQETRWQEQTIVLADGRETTVRMPRTVLECPCVISVAIAKTHDVCVVTLALKNLIMGTIAKPDRVKMHGFESHAERRLPDEARVLNVNLIRVSQHLFPHIAVIDGVRGVQGNGPGGTDAVELGAVAASADCIAADAVMTSAMGFDPAQMGLLTYAHQLGMGVADLERIDVRGARIADVRQQFKPHEKTPLQMQWRAPELAAAYLPTR